MRYNNLLIITFYLFHTISAGPVVSKNVDDDLQPPPPQAPTLSNSMETVSTNTTSNSTNKTENTLIEKALNPQIFYTPFHVVCPSREAILAMNPDPNFYQIIDGKPRPTREQLLFGDSVSYIPYTCGECDCDEDNGGLRPGTTMAKTPPHNPAINFRDYQDALNAIPFGIKQQNPAWYWQPYANVRMTWTYYFIEEVAGGRVKSEPFDDDVPIRMEPPGGPTFRTDLWDDRRVKPEPFYEDVPVKPEPFYDGVPVKKEPFEDPRWGMFARPGEDPTRPRKGRPRKLKLYPAGDPRGWAPGHYWDRHPGGRGSGPGRGGGMGAGGLLGKRDEIVQNVEANSQKSGQEAKVDNGVPEDGT
ncbi:hypothetical protein TWF281_001514 [Arthrobotrys megalospora]